MSEDPAPPAEAGLLLDAAALVERDDLVRVRVTGADRVDYLHRMLTQDLRTLGAGQTTYGCLLTVKGRILGDLQITNLGEALVLEMPRAAQAAVMPPLERYVIMDDVVFTEEPAQARWSLVGPDTPALLQQAGIDGPADGWIAEQGTRLLRRFDRRGLPHVEIVGEPTGIDAPQVGLRAYEIARVHHDIPAFGAELGEDVLFNEAGLEEAVSWTKGCYPGQEPVVMAKHRGRPPRRLVKITYEGPAVAAGAELLVDDKAVGHVTTAAPALDRWPSAALAYVQHRFAVAGQSLVLQDGAACTVRTVSGDVVTEEGSA